MDSAAENCMSNYIDHALIVLVTCYNVNTFAVFKYILIRFLHPTSIPPAHCVPFMAMRVWENSVRCIANASH